MARLDGRTALVTGAAGGIGEAICRRLAEEGAWVAVADIDEVRGVRLARGLGKSALFVKLDVTSDDAWGAAIETVTAQFGGLDILVNNAGVMIPATIEEATAQDWRTLMAVNGEGTFLGCKHAIAAMKTRGADLPLAVIINFTSSLAVNFTPQHAAYSASKAAVRALTKSAALHCGQAGYRIRVNNIQPGAVVTDMLRRNIRPGQTEDEYFGEVVKRHPIGRLGTPKDIADAVVFLASDEAAFMTGADLTVDGGNTA